MLNQESKGENQHLAKQKQTKKKEQNLDIHKKLYSFCNLVLKKKAFPFTKNSFHCDQSQKN